MNIGFAFVNRIVVLHEDAIDVIVQPSVQCMQMNGKIKDTGLIFPVDPAPSAKIGGMVGTNYRGTNVVIYRTMEDWVINLTVDLAEGRIIRI